MNIFTSQEYLVAQSVINKGLENASKALSALVKDNIIPVPVNIEDIRIDKTNTLEINPIPQTTLYLLTTAVMGDLKGSCCLVFTEEEATLLRETMLPPSIEKSAPIYEEMKNAILLEADNIIAAAMITEFANILKKKMYGNVPHLKILSHKELAPFIHENYSNKNTYGIEFKTIFNGSQKSFQPLFIWFLDETFINSIKNIDPINPT